MLLFLILFFIISITFLVITIYYRCKQEILQKKIETFVSNQNMSLDDKIQLNHNIKITFLTALQAKKLINKSESYIQNMNQPNLIARNANSIEELYNKYLNAFDDITPEEIETIKLFLLELLD
jgi:competence protein ComGC